MYRLAIIDDEFATRQGLRDMLDWVKLDIQIVGEAEDGFAAIAMVEQQKPDIIICDVRMPRLDGIALVAQLRPHHPDLQIIFLSGHSEKAYLRSAIRFGAIDYLDKPVRKEELVEVLKKAKERLKEAKGNFPFRAFQAYMSSLFTGGSAGSAERKALPQGLPVDFSKPYRLAVFTFGFHEQGAKANGLLFEQMLPPYTETLQSFFQVKALMHPFGPQYIGYFNPPADFEVAKLCAAYMKALPEMWKHTALCVSAAHKGEEDLPAAFRQAQEADRSFFHGFARSYQYDACFQPVVYDTNTMAIQKISRLVEEHAFSRAAEMLNGYCALIKRCRTADIDFIRKDLARLAIHLAKLYHPQDDAYQYAVLEHIKFNCLTLDEIRSYLQDLLGSIVSSFDSLLAKGRVIYDVQRYIQDHYAEDVSITDIAQHVYLTPTYLCYLYKKKTGKTLNTYMTEVKMQKAKELLKDHSLKLSDIAAMLGFNSSNYFTRTFMKQFGTSPTAYRNQQL